MNLFHTFVKSLVVFDLVCFGVYFGGDIVSTLVNKVRKKPAYKDPYEFLIEEEDEETEKPLTIDSIRMLYGGDVQKFVDGRLLPNAQETLDTLTEQEQSAARHLLCALIGYLKEEARMDEQSFPMVMELLNYMEGSKEDGKTDAVDMLMERSACRSRRCETHYNDYQRYRLMQVDKERVIAACRLMINDILGTLYRYDYRFGYDFMLTEENSIAVKLHGEWEEEWEDEEDEIGGC